MQFRPYHPANLDALLAFVGECNRIGDFCVNLHPGDIRHFMSNALRGGDPSPHFWLDTDQDGAIRSVVIIYQERDPAVDVMIHPDYHATDAEMDTLFAFAEDKMTALLRERGSSADEIGCEVLPCNPERMRQLEARGYVKDEPLFVLTRQSLARAIPDPVLPDGFTIRSAQGLHEAEALARVHASAFDSTWREGEYAKVMQSPAFSIDHEMVVVAPNGEFAAFCVIWIDPISKSGLFEPVGTAKDYRRRGLSSALLYAGMHRMRDEGMKIALVNHEPPEENPASAALYLSVGFEVVGTGVDFRKKISTQTDASASPAPSP